MERVVPFNDLGRHGAAITAQLVGAAQRVIERGWYLLGPETDGFEQSFADACGTSGCVTVANGTDALEIALRSLGCVAGDEVILSANAGGYATTACTAIGVTPVYADVDEHTLLLDAEAAEAVVGPATRAVVATHLYGTVVDVEDLRRRLPDGVAILEDGAQAHGARLRSRPVGSLGDLAAFSFYPTKNLGALGDAGAITSNRPELLDRARTLRQYGWESRYHATVPGGRNSRMDEIQAALLGVLLPHLDARNERRASIRQHYVAAVGDRLRFVTEAADAQPVVHLCVVRSPERDRLQADLAQLGVSCAVHFPTPDHLQPALEGRPHRHDGLAHTVVACDEVLSLPCFPELTDDEVDHVATALVKCT